MTQPHPHRHRMKKDLKQLLTEYGSVALVVYLTIFVAVLAGFWAAIGLGWRTESTAGTAGTLAGAYLATKLTQPLRIAATLVLTPIVAKLYEKLRPGRAAATDSAPERRDSGV